MTTIYDVAARAGVSPSSVSAVINGKTKQVSAATRRRVLESIEALGYRPNRVARQLITGRFDTIAVCHERGVRKIFSIEHEFIAGIGDSAGDDGFSVLITPAVPNVDFSHEIGSLSSRGVDGAVIIGPIPLKKQVTSLIEDCGVPVVCMDSYPAFSKTSTVDRDNVASMKPEIQNLISQGHSRIIYVGPPPVYQCFADRMQAFCEVMQDNDLPVDENAVRIVDCERASSLFMEILSRDVRPTAIVCADVPHGIAAWESAKSMGMRIPEDISLLAGEALPLNHPSSREVKQITTPRYEIGKTAVDVLKKIIAGELTPPVTIRLASETILPFPSPTI
ncbi:MAG: LacI family DNA-binding transcriptional regulator [Armatimonadota bacterium]|nr:LacI family transcriptional regulator [bacterium]